MLSPPFLPLWFLEQILTPPMPAVPCFILDHVLLLGHLPVISVPYNEAWGSGFTEYADSSSFFQEK